MDAEVVLIHEAQADERLRRSGAAGEMDFSAGPRLELGDEPDELLVASQYQVPSARRRGAWIQGVGAG
jgi:hypothetical protein